MSAWLFQDHRQKQKLGDKCPWSVGWVDPDGKRKSKRLGSKSAAEKFARKTEGQLAAGIYRDESTKKWSDFRKEYESRLEKTSPGNQLSAKIAMDHFQKIIKPVRLRGIRTATIEQYIAARLKERGSKQGSVVSVETVNKELRHIRAALRYAKKLRYLPEVPEIEMLKAPDRLPTFVTPDHFTAIYESCDVATRPEGLPFSAADWWRALLVFLHMTGWRIGETMTLLRDDVDLEAGTALTRAEKNKAKRDDLTPLHPLVIEHLRGLKSFDPYLFAWPHGRRALWDEFDAIQKAAGIKLPCHEEHQHSEACHCYGFHDLRRAFATANATRMSADALQRLMRHRSYQTTKLYVAMAQQLKPAVENLHVPALKKASSGK